MNYKRIYDCLIERAKNRKLEGYSEVHHIKPKCLGGSDDGSNLVALTAREHFVSHLLLAKIYGGKLWYAVWIMTNDGKHTSKEYAWLRNAFSKIQSVRMSKRKLSDETKRKMSESHKGKVFSKQHRENLSKAQKGVKEKPEVCKHLSEIQKGKKPTKEVIEARRLGMLRRYQNETPEQKQLRIKALSVPKRNMKGRQNALIA